MPASYFSKVELLLLDPVTATADISDNSNVDGIIVPYRCLAAATIGSGVAMAAAPALLSSAGFSKIGVTAGSLAAKWQAMYGSAGVASGSLFASLQATAMGGLGVSGGVLVSGTSSAAIVAFCKAVDDMAGNPGDILTRLPSTREVGEIARAIGRNGREVVEQGILVVKDNGRVILKQAPTADEIQGFMKLVSVRAAAKAKDLVRYAPTTERVSEAAERVSDASQRVRAYGRELWSAAPSVGDLKARAEYLSKKAKGSFEDGKEKSH
eukprot:TRINITY_DN47689_c0_g1_i1.p1 TRINITY_DN47689_c0_g1~~TRINITY_DN47689_c0_g1_i1.p1  ORF type:complete len:267 (-),score=36.16 TRINITY_DN47689_c0_g1_i1:281-1081(-)